MAVPRYNQNILGQCLSWLTDGFRSQPNIRAWLAIYAQLDNFLSQQHISPIGYTSLPFSIRTGLRFTLGRNIK